MHRPRSHLLASPPSRRHPIRTAGLILLTIVLVACHLPTPSPVQRMTTAPYTLEKIDPHPLYVMHYHADYPEVLTQDIPVGDHLWACSLFAALGDEENLLYGRNFDWEHSPAIVLYTAPPDGYASISTVNLTFLGFSDDQAEHLLSLDEEQREPLLQAPFLPIDGINVAGLTVGMAAVPFSSDGRDPSRPPIGSLGIIRELLDHAGTVGEAVEIMASYAIDFGDGPPIHYLLADAQGEAVLVEYGRGEMEVLPNAAPWHAATNFLLESIKEDPRGVCQRYDALQEHLTQTRGRLELGEAMDLLQAVSQSGPSATQWSAVYEIAEGVLHLALNRDYDHIHHFKLEETLP